MLRIGVALLISLGVLTGCAGPDATASGPPDGAGSAAAPDGGPTDEAQRLADAERSSPDRADVLGPAGWLGLNLGMSAPRAIATGKLVARTGPAVPCQQWTTVRAERVGGVFISRRLGVAAISAAPGSAVRTREGMTIGWTRDQVNTTYPSVSADGRRSDFRDVPVPGNTRAVYRVGFDDGGRVSAITLQLVNQDCYD